MRHIKISKDDSKGFREAVERFYLSTDTRVVSIQSIPQFIIINYDYI